jgi:hypothetical protein
MTTPQLEQLAWDLECRGFAGQEVAIHQVVRSARAAGISRTLVDVLADPAEPEIARLRAFGRVATALGNAVPPAPQRHARHDAAA